MSKPRVAPVIDIFGVGIHCISENETVAEIERALEKRRRLWIVTVNANYLMRARRDPEFAKLIAEADLVVPDGMPLVWLARAKGARGQTRVNGTDLVARCAELSAHTGVPVALIGGRLAIAEKAAECLRGISAGARVAAVDTPFPLDATASQTVVADTRALGAQIALVGLTTGQQERWIVDNRDALGQIVVIGVGGAFDIISGQIARAPLWMQRSGLEWFWRLSREPRRLWRRYLLEDAPFAWLALRELVASLWRR
jgi:N-acetylglucosaminyldiphosphoundecaprenol N-acetyl-beta-D-mannosaminyltransferase